MRLSFEEQRGEKKKGISCICLRFCIWGFFSSVHSDGAKLRERGEGFFPFRIYQGASFYVCTRYFFTAAPFVCVCVCVR